MKYGCSTGWTRGKLRLDGAVFRAPHPIQDGDAHFNVCLHNQFEVSSDTKGDFAASCDSGALVFMENNDELVAVGMVAAGMAEDVCFVTPLHEILKALGLDPSDGLKQFNLNVNRGVSDGSGVIWDNRSATPEDIKTLRSSLMQVISDVESMKDDAIGIKEDMNGMKDAMGNMERDMHAMRDNMNDGMGNIERRMNDMKSGIDAIMTHLQKTSTNQQN